MRYKYPNDAAGQLRLLEHSRCIGTATIISRSQFPITHLDRAFAVTRLLPTKNSLPDLPFSIILQTSQLLNRPFPPPEHHPYTISPPSPPLPKMALEDACTARAEKPHVVLIPWDPESAEHCERLRLQRVACGWKMDKIEVWREKQREGKMSIHWAVSDYFFCFVT